MLQEDRKLGGSPSAREVPTTPGHRDGRAPLRPWHPVPPRAGPPLSPVCRRRRRALSDRLRARALSLGLQSPFRLDEAAAALASEAGGNHAALRRALRGLPVGDDCLRSPAAERAARALRLAAAEVKWSTYDDTVSEPA